MLQSVESRPRDISWNLTESRRVSHTYQEQVAMSKGVQCSWCDRQSKYTYTPTASRQVGPTAPEGQVVEEEPLENQVEVLKMSHRELMERV